MIETFWHDFKNIEHYFAKLIKNVACNPAIPALDIYTRETLACVPQETYAGMFIIAPKDGRSGGNKNCGIIITRR